FLLAFRAEDGGPRYILIDCGVHDKYQGGDERLKSIAKDIAQTTGNKLHIVAVTHEHTDHLYGFMHGKDSFQNIEIDELWLPWTEDPQNALAQELKKIYGTKIRALQAAIAKLNAAGNPHAVKLTNLFSFDLGTTAVAGMKGNKGILESLRTWSRKKLERAEDYRTPGENPIELPGVKGVRCYVLGPPENVEFIKKLTAQKEMYFNATPLTEETAFISAAMAAADKKIPGGSQELQGYPFDAKFSIPEKEAAKERDGFFQTYYGFNDQKKQGPRWRRIETDWLANPAEELALSINSLTNNTSLVLAFELTGTDPAKVLLFTGDAQVGNWLSWQNVSWTTKSGKEKETITGADLLRRTVLYKVGHHGSANATLREKGLEMMDSPEFVAMIPVDADWALRTMGWHHPEDKIVARLMQKARGRVIRSDRIPKGNTFDKPEEARDADWEVFLKNLEWDRSPDGLWIQYTIQ
ncbi:MAG: hypothetical protein WC294_11050, partial [Methanoregula sp.]